MADVGTKVRSIVAETLRMEARDIPLEATFFDDLGADSLDLMSITVALESEFDMELQAQSLQQVETVQDLSTLIQKNLIDG